MDVKLFWLPNTFTVTQLYLETGIVPGVPILWYHFLKKPNCINHVWVRKQICYFGRGAHQHVLLLALNRSQAHIWCHAHILFMFDEYKSMKNLHFICFSQWNYKLSYFVAATDTPTKRKSSLFIKIFYMSFMLSEYYLWPNVTIITNPLIWDLPWDFFGYYFCVS